MERDGSGIFASFRFHRYLLKGYNESLSKKIGNLMLHFRLQGEGCLTKNFPKADHFVLAVVCNSSSVS